MKKIFFAVLITIAGWCTAQAQSLPAPETFNEYIKQVAEMANVSQEKAEFLINATMEALSDDGKKYRQMMDLAERRFSDPADSLHNEGLYLAVLKHTTEKFVLSGAEKEKQRLLLEGAKKNMIGTEAADFDYVIPGKKTVNRLKELKADHILVYFNNPDCESCEIVKQRLADNEFINQLVNDGKLIVLAIYPYDDQKLWKKAKYPEMMINGWNQSRSIEYNELYDLPTLPCFYLLDKDHKVMMKNEGSLNKVEAELKQPSAAQAMGSAPAMQTIPVTPKNNPQTSQTAQVAQNEPPIPAPADDPNAISSEQLMGYLLNNQKQAIYDNLSEKMKSRITPDVFENALSQVEEKMGKYQSHDPWEIQKINGIKTYTSLVHFEKGALGLAIMYDKEGKMVTMNMVPPSAINK